MERGSAPPLRSPAPHESPKNCRELGRDVPSYDAYDTYDARSARSVSSISPQVCCRPTIRAGV
jgi:hypothetical protein